jgi:tRNA 2-thiouridine synthesizing protein E
MHDPSHGFSAIAIPAYDRPYNLETLGLWSKDMAIALASTEGIVLTSDHWEVIDALRNHYQEYGPDANGRSLLKCMET